MNIVVLGISGSGKTTLIEAFTGQYPEYTNMPEFQGKYLFCDEPYLAGWERILSKNDVVNLQIFQEFCKSLGASLRNELNTYIAFPRMPNVVIDRGYIDRCMYLSACSRNYATSRETTMVRDLYYRAIDKAVQRFQEYMTTYLQDIDAIIYVEPLNQSKEAEEDAKSQLGLLVEVTNHFQHIYRIPAGSIDARVAILQETIEKIKHTVS